MTEEVTAETRAEAVVDALGALYHDNLDPDEFMLFPDDDGVTIEAEGELSDWGETFGGRPAFECLVRTILSQNTSDTASQPAHENLLDRYDDGGDLAESLAAADHATLAETIHSAGLYNQKAEKIIGAADWVLDEYGSAEAFNEFVTAEDPEAVRDTLLSVDGVGPKTADCVLLFSGGRGGVFPVDTHVHRIARRMGLADPAADHEAVREALEATVPAEKCGFGNDTLQLCYTGGEKDGFDSGGEYVVDGEKTWFAHGGVPPEKCGFGHTAMIQFGREYCTARKPACLDGPEACPLSDLCDRVGVDIESGEVVDPAETAD